MTPPTHAHKHNICGGKVEINKESSWPAWTLKFVLRRMQKPPTTRGIYPLTFVHPKRVALSCFSYFQPHLKVAAGCISSRSLKENSTEGERGLLMPRDVYRN